MDDSSISCKDESPISIHGDLANRGFAHREATYISLTDKAREQIINRVQQREIRPDGIKISVVTRGCSGLAYKLEYAEYGVNISTADEVCKIDDSVYLFIDQKSSLFFFGTKMDYEDNGIEYGFKFINPNESGKCGCGESFFV